MINKNKFINNSLGLLLPISASAFAETIPLEEVEVEGKRYLNTLHLKDTNSASNRLGLKSMDIPGSVDIISKQDIALKADYSPLSAVTRSAGFAATASPGNGGTSMAVRGFNGHSSVVQTYDGTRLYVGAGTVTFPADTWTLERVEVLRGPGSVINGVGAIGATINYVPKSPQFGSVRNELDVTAGSFGLLRLAIGSGGGISDDLAYRVDAVSHKSDGDVDDADEQRSVFAGSLHWQATDNLDIKLSVDYADIDASTYWGTPLIDGKVDQRIRKNNYNIKDGIVNYEDLWPRLNAQWQINDNATLRSDSYYLMANRHWRNVESYSFNPDSGQVDRAYYLEILHDQTQLGNRSDMLFEFDTAGMANRLSVGAEVNRIDFTHKNNRSYGGTTSVDLLNPLAGKWADGVEYRTSKDFSSETMHYAIFIDEHIQINDQFSLVGGLRHDSIDFDRNDVARSNGPEHAEPYAVINDDLSGTSWRFGAVYQPQENISLYAQASKAVDSVQSILTASTPNMKLAEGKQLEVGLKQILMNDNLQYTVALFDIRKDNLLANDAFGQSSQIGEQRSKGIELEVFMRLSDTLNISMNSAFTDAEYEHYKKSSGDAIRDYSGNTPKDVPEQTANLWLDWRFIQDWAFSGGARYVGTRFVGDDNSAKLPSYTVYDASLQWHIDEDLQLTLRGKNLSDETDYVLAPYGDQWILAEGRSAELGLHYNF
ncbi:iron complex outermembrane receptor protein [Sinobacterium caligoides]|uniref:Iron complex outermembrane receptor protein n=1 Tax=Sinobacterium caligoides TaxID=933926 RepID=A0A3N2DZ09_9GAMM|nr:TonB-dependent siderophore receptor [Sinobacterium caligoides]ROS05101.1 iron complex outermembrane receptor protein [Sinobacterium caligoides]